MTVASQLRRTAGVAVGRRRMLAGLAQAAAPDMYPACNRFYRCVGLNVRATGTDRDPLSTYTFTTYSVNGKTGWTSGDICGSPITTAGRFGVPWGSAMTEWQRARANESCTYNPGDTIQTGGGQQGGAPGAAPTPGRGSAGQPSLPWTAPVVLNAIQSECGLNWEHAQTPSALSPSDITCIERVKADLRSEGYGGSTGGLPVTEPASVPWYEGDPAVKAARNRFEGSAATGEAPLGGLLDGSDNTVVWLAVAGLALYAFTRK